MKEEVQILVVDDEEMLRSLLTRTLEREGYSVATASGGKSAAEMLSKNRYQIMVSDVKMPEMNGFDLLKFAKARDPKMAVVMMTGFGDDFTVKEAIMLGADEYVMKPFKSADIVAAVERAWWRSLAGPAKPAKKNS